jgi:transcription initiation factor TFIID subunit 12
MSAKPAAAASVAAAAPAAAAAVQPLAAVDSLRSSEALGPLLSAKGLKELVQSVAPDERLDRETELLLLDLADDFVEDVATFACALARHRGAAAVEAKDVRLHLERSWAIHVPGGDGELRRPLPSVGGTDAYRRKLVKLAEARKPRDAPKKAKSKAAAAGASASSSSSAAGAAAAGSKRKREDAGGDAGGEARNGADE